MKFNLSWAAVCTSTTPISHLIAIKESFESRECMSLQGWLLYFINCGCYLSTRFDAVVWRIQCLSVSLFSSVGCCRCEWDWEENHKAMSCLGTKQNQKYLSAGGNIIIWIFTAFNSSLNYVRVKSKILIWCNIEPYSHINKCNDRNE